MGTRCGFIVDTNSYSGNFEREMCAFMTGCIGECEVGDEEADLYKKQYKALEDIVYSVADEHGCLRPVEMATTPGYWNNGVGFEYVDGEEDKALAHFKKYITDDRQRWIETVEGHRGKNVPTWTDEAIDRTVIQYKKEIANAQALNQPHKYPSYQSIMIFMERKPDEELVEFLKKRAYEYCDYYNENGMFGLKPENKLKIVGFRFRTIRTLEEDEGI